MHLVVFSHRVHHMPLLGEKVFGLIIASKKNSFFARDLNRVLGNFSTDQLPLRSKFCLDNDNYRRASYQTLPFNERMEREILLVANSDTDSNAIVELVAKESGYRLRKVSSTRQAFDILATDLDNVDLVIIDLDPGVHSLTILEAIGGHPVAPPVIALTSLEESEVTPIANRYGAVACLGKPFQHASLSKAIELCLARPRSVSCDLWGHPGQRRRRERARQPA